MTVLFDADADKAPDPQSLSRRDPVDRTQVSHHRLRCPQGGLDATRIGIFNERSVAGQRVIVRAVSGSRGQLECDQLLAVVRA